MAKGSMSYISKSDRQQVLLFPEIIDEYIKEENPVRFIDVFVEGLNLEALGFKRAESGVMGRPSYDPRDLLRLYIYGYLNRIRSSRMLEREAQSNVEVMWLMGKLTPDFKTIADFRKDNAEAMKGVCRQFTVLCRDLELFGGELLGIDGSKFRAVNSKKHNFNEKKLNDLMSKIDRRVRDYMEELDRADQLEAETRPAISKEDLKAKIEELKKRQQKYGKYLQELKRSGEKEISVIDCESRLMPSQQGLNVCYNVQTAVDSKHKLIVEHEVVNANCDQNQLSSIAIAAKEALGVQQVEVVADKGYYNGQEVKKCEQAGIIAYVAKPQTVTSSKQGLFGKEQFVYDEKTDTYGCPVGQQLSYRYTTDKTGQKMRIYRSPACKECGSKPQCTRSAKGRTIKRLENERVLERMHERLRAHPQKIRLRGSLCEHPFGTLKRGMNAGFFLMKGLRKVRAEMSLSILAYNLKRALQIMGLPRMMQVLEKKYPLLLAA